MSTVDFAGAGWRTSSYSDGDGHSDQCVEVAVLGGVNAVRDSKDRGGPVLLPSAAAWHAFMAGVKAGEFDH